MIVFRHPHFTLSMSVVIIIQTFLHFVVVVTFLTFLQISTDCEYLGFKYLKNKRNNIQ